MTESNLNGANGEGLGEDINGLLDSLEARLRGVALNGAEQRSSVEHEMYEMTRDPDSDLRLDGEDETLYSDGLDIGDDDDWLAGADGEDSKGFKG